MQDAERTEVLQCLDSIISYCRDVKQESPTHFGTIQVAAERCRKKVCSFTMQHKDGVSSSLTKEEVRRSQEAGLPKGTVITDKSPASVSLNCYLYHEVMWNSSQVCPHCMRSHEEIKVKDEGASS
jgi:hypothetical protein